MARAGARFVPSRPFNCPLVSKIAFEVVEPKDGFHSHKFVGDFQIIWSAVRLGVLALACLAALPALAVTTATMRAMTVMRPVEPFEMILDHPFFFVIGDETTHSILFMGVVSDPGVGVSQ